MKLVLFACLIGIMFAAKLPAGPHTKVGSSFVYVEILMGWDDAQAYCANVFGTSLATVDSRKDVKLVTPVCDPPKDPNDGKSCPSDQDITRFGNAFNCGCWIGLFRESGTRSGENGPWQWADGVTEYEYTNWGTGSVRTDPQPDNIDGVEYCVSLQKDFEGQPDGSWNDRPCDGVSGDHMSQYFFCNAEVPVTTTTTIAPIAPIDSSDSSGAGSASSDDFELVFAGESVADNQDGALNDNPNEAVISISFDEATKIQFVVFFVVMLIFTNVLFWCYKYKSAKGTEADPVSFTHKV